MDDQTSIVESVAVVVVGGSTDARADVARTVEGVLAEAGLSKAPLGRPLPASVREEPVQRLADGGLVIGVVAYVGLKAADWVIKTTLEEVVKKRLWPAIKKRFFSSEEEAAPASRGSEGPPASYLTIAVADPDGTVFAITARAGDEFEFAASLDNGIDALVLAGTPEKGQAAEALVDGTSVDVKKRLYVSLGRGV